MSDQVGNQNVGFLMTRLKCLVISDKIDQSISARQSEQLVIICAFCGSVYQKSEIKCDTCKVNLHASQKETFQMYK